MAEDAIREIGPLSTATIFTVTSATENVQVYVALPN